MTRKSRITGTAAKKPAPVSKPASRIKFNPRDTTTEPKPRTT